MKYTEYLKERKLIKARREWIIANETAMMLDSTHAHVVPIRWKVCLENMALVYLSQHWREMEYNNWHGYFKIKAPKIDMQKEFERADAMLNKHRKSVMSKHK